MLLGDPVRDMSLSTRRYGAMTDPSPRIGERPPAQCNNFPESRLGENEVVQKKVAHRGGGGGPSVDPFRRLERHRRPVEAEMRIADDQTIGEEPGLHEPIEQITHVSSRIGEVVDLRLMHPSTL